MRHLFRGTVASPLGAAVQHNARVCSLDVEGVETAWELPVRGPRQPHTLSKPQRAPSQSVTGPAVLAGARCLAPRASALGAAMSASR
jgi:hypothetical protein